MPDRVLHIIGDILKGGTESVVFNYYRYIDRDKVQFDFVAHEDSPFEIPDDIKALGCMVYKVPNYKHLSTYIKAIDKICTDGNYKIIHSHMNALSLFPLYAAKKAGVPVRIAHSHSAAVWGVKSEFMRTLFKVTLRPFAKIFPTNLYACSIYAGNWLFGKWTMKSGKVTVLANAIDTQRFSYSETNRKRIREELGYSDENYVISHIGRFVPQKNHSYILDVFFEAYKRDNNLRLLLIGDGSGKTEIAHRAEKFNKGNSIESVAMLDSRDNVNEYYSAMDLFILPSLYEGLAVVRVEAVSAGTPCLVSAGNTAEFDLFDEKFLPIGEENIAKWVDAILEKRHRVVNSAQILAEHGFDIRNEAWKLEQFYLSVINKAKYNRSMDSDG